VSPISIAVAVLATVAASAGVLVVAAWLLVRAARARIADQDRIAARVEAFSAEPRASADSLARVAAAEAQPPGR